MACDVALAALKQFDFCEETLDGARVSTHCLYPSFESVHVYLVRVGDTYSVHDGSGAYLNAWTHGRDEHAISRALMHEAEKYHLSVVGDSIVAQNVSEVWLPNAILSVANASAMGASRAVAKIAQASEKALADRISDVLHSRFSDSAIVRELHVRGRSGGERKFDFAVKGRGDFELLINAVLPHRGSVNSKYVTFADTEIDTSRKFAVIDRPLMTDDISLLSQVSSIVPIGSLGAGSERIVAFTR